MEHIKKVTQKDRYGNQVSYEFENPVKPIDQTELMKKMMDDMQEVPEMSMEVPMYDHPGEPKGTDTVPAWLTPGEFVVNKEATEIYGDEIKAMNDHGRELQAAKGMEVPGYQTGGNVPFIAGPMLTDPKFMQEGGWVTDELLDKLMEVESGGDPDAVSPAGAIGLYQWLPTSAAQAGYGVKPFDPKDPKAARAATKKYLENMQKYHGFTPEETLRAYNWGPGNVINYNKGKRKDIPAEALNYPGKILGVENIEGVPVHGDMPVPTPRPFQNGGNVYQDAILRDNPPVQGATPDYTSGLYDVPNPNVVPEIKPGGHAMFGGDQNLGGGMHPLGTSPEALIAADANIPTEDGPPESAWWHSLLGPKSKEALNLPTTDADKDFLEKQIATNEKLASQDIAEEENLIADMTGEQSVTGIDEVPKEVKPEDKPQVDTYDDKINKGKIIKEEADKEAAKEGDGSTGPGEGQGGANVNEKTVEAAGEEAVNADPSLVDQVKNAFSDAFKSLLNPTELAKAAILYAGSRAMGYSHGGSMQWVAGKYLENVQAAEEAKIAAAGTREKRAFELAKTDKFTPASVAAYRKSGNPGDLISKKAVAGATSTGITEQRIGKDGKKISLQQVKMPNGSVGYQLPGGKVVTKAWIENNSKPYDPSFDKGTSEYRTRRSRATKSMTELFKEIQGREDRFTVDRETKYKTGIIPQQAAQDFWTFAESYGIDPESDEAQDLMGAAYRQAIAQSNIKDAPIAKNLKPFLEAAYIRQQTGAPELFQVNPDKDPKENAKFVRSDKMNQLTTSMDSLANIAMPNHNKTDARNNIIGSLITDWGALSEDDKKQWNRRANKGVETGFYLYSKDRIDNYIMKGKLGE